MENGKQGDVRTYVDMRKDNKTIISERHLLPTIAETTRNGRKEIPVRNWPQFGLPSDGSLSLVLKITTFVAPDGLHRYKGFIFGLNMIQEKNYNRSSVRSYTILVLDI